MNQKEPIIFIIAGKARAGKDTTAKIIKKYAENKDLKVINLQFSSYIKMYAKNITNWDGSEETKPRTLLQELSTDVIRKKIDSFFFINRIIEDIKVYSFYADIITISDTRLPEELDTISNTFHNVHKVLIKRPSFDNNLTDKEKQHLTEIALDNYTDYNLIINNDKTLEDLEITVINKIKSIIKK